MRRKMTKSIWGWALYDWANSAFATTIMAGFFPVFFKQYWSYGTDVNTSTAQLGFGNAVAALIVAAMSPLLGAVADSGGARKRFLAFFAYLGVAMTAALFLVGKGQWPLAIVVYAVGIIGFSGANTFYDALLPQVSTTGNVDWVSSFGFSLGYLGGGVLFLINVAMTLKPQWFGLSDAATAIRVAFLSVAVWWGGFTVFTLLWVPEQRRPSPGLGTMLLAGVQQVRRTFGRLRSLKPVMIFLLAYWCYIDGVDTIIRMAVDYGLSLGFAAQDLIVALLIVQFVGFPAALVFGRLGEKWGARKAIYLGIGVYMAVTIYGSMMDSRGDFFVMAAVIGLVQGGIQALSRSYFTRLIPDGQEAEFFGLYNMLGKFAAILGPALMAVVSLVARRMLMPPNPTAAQISATGEAAARLSIAAILVLFLAGGILLAFVKDPAPSVSSD
jgi:UMF1 family MFS transporter